MKHPFIGAKKLSPNFPLRELLCLTQTSPTGLVHLMASNSNYRPPYCDGPSSSSSSSRPNNPSNPHASGNNSSGFLRQTQPRQQQQRDGAHGFCSAYAATQQPQLQQMPGSADGKKKYSGSQSCGGYMIRPLLTEWCQDGSTRFNIQDYPIQALSAMNEFRQDGHLCDIVLEVDGKRIHAHKLVLAACSLYFRGMFTHGMMEADSDLVTIREPSITAEVMRILVDFAYTQFIHITQENVQQILVSAIFLEMSHVIEACTLFMEQQLDSGNCIGFSVFARQHGCLDLEQKATKFIVENFCNVITYDEVLSLDRNEFMELISKDSLNIRCESEVFRAVVRWVEFDPDKRKQYTESLLHKVRLSSLAPGFLVNQLKKCSIIRSLPHCERMLEDSVSHLTSHQACPDRSRKTCKSKVIYVVGGFCRKTMESMTCFECYNPRSKEWTRLPDLPIARSMPGVTSLKGVVYVLGGRLRKCGQDFDSCSVNLYDPNENKWSTRCPMNAPRNRVGVGILDDNIYAVGGRSGGELFKSAERYDPEHDTWTKLADLNTGRMGSGIAVVNRLLYAVGGTDDKNRRLRSVECYNPEMNQWLEVAPLHHPRSGAGVAVLNDYIYAVGGFDGEQQLQSVERYDTHARRWDEVASLPSSRSGVQVAVLGGKVYTLGGFDGTDFLSTVQSYNPDTDTWHEEANMLCKRSGHGVAVSVLPEHL